MPNLLQDMAGVWSVWCFVCMAAVKSPHFPASCEIWLFGEILTDLCWLDGLTGAADDLCFSPVFLLGEGVMGFSPYFCFSYLNVWFCLLAGRNIGCLVLSGGLMYVLAMCYTEIKPVARR